MKKILVFFPLIEFKTLQFFQKLKPKIEQKFLCSLCLISAVQTIEHPLKVPLSIHRFQEVCFLLENANLLISTSARVKFRYITMTHSLRMPES